MSTYNTADPIYYRHPLYAGHRAEASRNYRANYAAGRATGRDFLQGERTPHVLLAHGIDGVDHGDHTYASADEHGHHARAERLAADYERREYVFDCAEDHGSVALDRTYRRAGIAQARNARAALASSR